MIKKIEEVFDLPSMESEVNSSYPSDQEEQTTGLDLDKMQRQLEVADKIDAALPMVRDLEQLDADMDKYADKAMHAFQDLMDLLRFLGYPRISKNLQGSKRISQEFKGSLRIPEDLQGSVKISNNYRETLRIPEGL